MPLLTPLNVDEFPHGTKVRVVRSGYQRHYLGEIDHYEGDYVVMDLYYPWDLSSAGSARFDVGGDYCVAATPDMEWDAIRSEWIDQQDALRRMDESEPCAWEDIPLRLRQIVMGEEVPD